MPVVKGLEIHWADESTWPVESGPDGTYLRAPKYYAICDDDADTSVAGVLEVLTQVEWISRKTAEHEAIKPHASWIGDLDTMSWSAPVPLPEDAVFNGGNVRYRWDESVVNWAAVTPE
jgi:hypothetical protein